MLVALGTAFVGWLAAVCGSGGLRRAPAIA
jgi:hypothetical protein